MRSKMVRLSSAILLVGVSNIHSGQQGGSTACPNGIYNVHCQSGGTDLRGTFECDQIRGEGITESGDTHRAGSRSCRYFNLSSNWPLACGTHGRQIDCDALGTHAIPRDQQE